ncbi:hypothetical protein J6590_052087 [Homalodisca vitripennis]|nr:hypothetical protein J6590_052087 [Homalodisca vitripennis]
MQWWSPKSKFYDNVHKDNKGSTTKDDGVAGLEDEAGRLKRWSHSRFGVWRLTEARILFLLFPKTKFVYNLEVDHVVPRPALAGDSPSPSTALPAFGAQHSTPFTLDWSNCFLLPKIEPVRVELAGDTTTHRATFPRPRASIVAYILSSRSRGQQTS